MEDRDYNDNSITEPRCITEHITLVVSNWHEISTCDASSDLIQVIMMKRIQSPASCKQILRTTLNQGALNLVLASDDDT